MRIRRSVVAAGVSVAIAMGGIARAEPVAAIQLGRVGSRRLSTLFAASSGIASGASPERLAFTNGDVELRVVGRDGSNERVLASQRQRWPLVAAKWLDDPSWSPDGSRVAYARTHFVTWASARSELRIAHADGSGEDTLLSLPGAGVIHEVAWSPDGRRLAFTLWTINPAGIVTWSSIGSRWDVYVINVDGSGLHPVAPVHASYAGGLDWAPDSKRLAFVSDAEGINAVYTVRIDRVRPPKRLSPLTTSAADPRWSPDGARVAFIGLPPAWVGAVSPALWLVEVDGSNPRRLPAATWHPPSWSPDGQWLAYACHPECGIAVIGRDGLSGRVLTTEPDYWPEWSRHGEIAFIRSSGTCCERLLWVMNADGSNQRAVSSASSVEFGFAWSH